MTKTREQHKVELMDALHDAPYERLVQIVDRAKKTIAYNKQCWVTQNANGMNVPAEQLRKNNARAELEIECATAILDEAMRSYGDR